MVTTSLGLRVTPHGHLVCAPQDEAPSVDEAIAARLAEAFTRGSGHGLLRLGAAEVGQALPPVFAWWRGFAARYVTALCLYGAGRRRLSRDRPEVPAPTETELAELVLTEPMMAGAEYLTPDVLRALWDGDRAGGIASLAATGGRSAGLPQGPEPGLEPGRPRAFQSGREPPRRRSAVRVHGDLHDAALGAGQGAASAAGPGAARIRRRGEPRQAALAAAAGAACRRDLRLAAADGRCRRDFPSAALDPAEASRLLAKRRRTRRRRRGRAHAGDVAAPTPGAPEGHGDGRRARALETRAGRAAGFLASR